MATILVTPLAQEDLGDIWDYVAESGVERADQLLDLIYEKCQRRGLWCESLIRANQPSLSVALK